MKDNSELAVEYFKSGYSCAQSVLLACCEEAGLDEQTALLLGSSFGGGMARLREVCGTVSAMFMIAGMKHGFTVPRDIRAKSEHYALIQKLAAEFKKRNGSIICRELTESRSSDPAEITDRQSTGYNAHKGCLKLIKDAAEICALML